MDIPASRLGKKWLLHFPVVVAWFHLLCYLHWQLFLYDRPPKAFDRTNMIVHTVTLMSVGLAGGWIYAAAIQPRHRSGTALKFSTSEAAP